MRYSSATFRAVCGSFCWYDFCAVPLDDNGTVVGEPLQDGTLDGVFGRNVEPPFAEKAADLGAALVGEVPPHPCAGTHNQFSVTLGANILGALDGIPRKCDLLRLVQCIRNAELGIQYWSHLQCPPAFGLSYFDA